MSGKEENENKLLLAIIRQLSVNGKLTGVDWNQVANDLGLERGATNMRWFRFKEAHGLNSSAKTSRAPSGAGANKVTKAKGKGGKKAVAGTSKGKKKTLKEENEGEEVEEQGSGNGSGGEENGAVLESSFAEQGKQMYDEKNGPKWENGFAEQGEEMYHTEGQRDYGVPDYGYKGYGGNAYAEEG